MDLSQLYWREPYALLLALSPLFFLVFKRWTQKRKLLRFADANLIPWLSISESEQVNRWPTAGLWMGWICLTIALAGPRTILQLPPDYRAQPASVMVVLDLSASMNARDLRPDRRSLAQQLLTRLLADSDNILAVGIVVFSGHAFRLMPPTGERAVVSHFIDSLNDIRLPTAGNALADAIELARQSLPATGDQRFLLILTDGDMEVAEQDRVNASFNAESDLNAIQTLVIGVADSKPVSVPDHDRTLLQFQGRPVLSRLEAQWLKNLARRDNIQYLHYAQLLQPSMHDLLQLSVKRADSVTQSRIRWQEWFFIPLLLGVSGLLMSSLMNARKTSRTNTDLPSLVVMGLSLSLVSQFIPATGYAQDQTAALVPLNRANTVSANFAEATVCYRAQDYQCAQQGFAAAAWLATDQQQRAVAVFNLANSYFFLGDYDQAAVLYRDAELLGIAPELIAINLSYAESMQHSIQKQLDLVRQNFARAQWKAALNAETVPTLQEFLSNDDNLMVTQSESASKQNFYRVPTEMINNEILSALGFSRTATGTAATRWIETERVLPRTTAGMLNRLFEMELQIPLSVAQPQLVEGKRKW